MVAHDPGLVVYRMHGGARSAYTIAGVLCCLLIIGIPFGVWLIVAASRGRIELRADSVVAVGLTTTVIRFADVHRLGFLNVPIVARGIGAVIARKKVGGDQAVNLCAMDARGKTRKFIASMYENYNDVFQRVSGATHRPVEQLAVGLMSPKWPEAPAA
jgi:hypothetical protein